MKLFTKCYDTGGDPHVLEFEDKYEELVKEYLILNELLILDTILARVAAPQAHWRIHNAVHDSYENCAERMKVAGIFKDKHDFRTRWYLKGFSEIYQE